MTRVRQQEAAYATLQSALSAAASPLPVIAQQVAMGGISAATDSNLRGRDAWEVRIGIGRDAMRAALTEMGKTAAQYFTPEEKNSFAQWLRKRCAEPMSLADVEAFAVPLAQSAGLADREAAWQYELMMGKSEQPYQLTARMQAYADLQKRRLKFADLGPQLETFAPRLGRQPFAAYLAAADAYRAAGNEESELRVLSRVQFVALGPENQKRFLGLMLARRPQQLVQMASQWTPAGEQAADFAVAIGDFLFAQSVIAARSKARPPVWSKAYNALAGLYFAEAGAGTNGNFVSALGDGTIGERIGKPVDRNSQLAGDIWYYYGSRYGEYLGATKQGNADDFLPADLEQSPASSSGYLALADYYMEIGDTRAAIVDYNHTLELEPNRADVHERLALAYYKQGARAEAIAQWKLVFATLTKEVNSARIPENVWTDFGRASDDLRTRRLFAELKPEADGAACAPIFARMETTGSNLLLRSAYIGIGRGNLRCHVLDSLWT